MLPNLRSLDGEFGALVDAAGGHDEQLPEPSLRNHIETNGKSASGGGQRSQRNGASQRRRSTRRTGPPAPEASSREAAAGDEGAGTDDEAAPPGRARQPIVSAAPAPAAKPRSPSTRSKMEVVSVQ